MDSLVGYGSDDDIETERYGHQASVGSHRRREDDTNYDQVNMDLSEDSQGEESEPELPQAESRVLRQTSGEDQSSSTDSRDAERPREYGKDRERDRHRDRDRDRERKDKRRESPRRDRERSERDRRSPRRDDKYRSDRIERPRDAPRRGLLGDRPDDRHPPIDSKMPALMDLKPFGSDGPPRIKSQDARDAVSPRFVDRRERDHERDHGRDRDSDRDRERERDYDGRHNRRSEDRRSSGRDRGSERSRSRGHAYPPPHTSNERRSPSSGDYRPSSYKVNKKLEVMEKMGLQIKTPDGSMTTAQQLRAAAGDHPSGLPGYCNPGSNPASKILDQVQKRKLLWSNKTKSAEEEAAKWSGARFSQDNDGKQVSKFMRLMGIKDPSAAKGEVPDDADPNKKQEELFQAMQAQYEVARATTHTMRGVGLGFQRGQY
ncbi:U1 small nuclear ribonucleoprotein 70 kDa isoform X1 [Pieris brassicae]|uniref:U1 small nuclear ribonucleoprotein 70 kDa isoform X1 n=1 Tax=Pieris brassicae TaxID=7116 RepID=UPI001E661148|nr:U1 small nuclear ribonucleoprotein 70 kDa isoform X1 [Pieris brassicae]